MIVGRTRYIIKNGIVGRLGRIVSKDRYFGEDALLNEEYVREYGAVALSYVDMFVLDREVLHEVLAGGAWPNIKVRSAHGGVFAYVCVLVRAGLRVCACVCLMRARGVCVRVSHVCAWCVCACAYEHVLLCVFL